MSRGRLWHHVLGASAALLAVAAGSAWAQAGPPAYPTPGATPQAANLISNFEGFSATPYNDAQRGGNCTIGYGTLIHRGPCTPADSGRYPGGVTRQQALQLLQGEANNAANAIDRDVTVPLTANQRDALTSFIYNVGVGAFQGSTLLRDLNSGNAQAAANELLRWRNQNGHPVQGLINRRNAERCYFLQGATNCQGPLSDARTRRAQVDGSVSAAAAAAPHRAKLRLTSVHPRAGHKLRFKGIGWTRGAVKVVAFVPGISPYRAVTLHASANRHGHFTLTWRVSRRISDSLRWKTTAAQGPRSARIYVRIRRA